MVSPEPMIRDIALTDADKDWLPEDYWQSIPKYMRIGIQKHFAQRRLAMQTSTDLGVTGNAVLLLDYIAGALVRDDSYSIESIDAAAGTQVLRRCGTDNLYSVAVRQIAGVE